MGPDGSVYVADSNNDRIQKFASDGDLDTKWGEGGTVGSEGAGAGEFSHPHGVAVGPDGSLYVADTWNHRIQKFAGSPSSFTVKLTAEPSQDVSVTVESEDTTEVAASPDTLTFTTANWDVPQYVILTGGEVDADQVTRVTVSVDAGASADEYDDVRRQTIDVTTIDVD